MNMAQEDPKGFAVDVGELDTIANSYLPRAAEALRAPIKVIMARERINGPGTLPAVRAMEAEYAGFVSSIGFRQQKGCGRIDETARALREIVILYRRVDGQG
jgi:hypothetical protein